MSNEELAIRIQQGEEYLIPQLWEQVVKFIAMKAREYISHKGQQGLPCSGEETDLTNQASIPRWRARSPTGRTTTPTCNP